MKRKVVFTESDSDNDNDAFNESLGAKPNSRHSIQKRSKTSDRQDKKVQLGIMDLLQKVKEKNDAKHVKSKSTLDAYFKSSSDKASSIPKRKEVSVDEFFGGSNKSKSEQKPTKHDGAIPNKLDSNVESTENKTSPSTTVVSPKKELLSPKNGTSKSPAKSPSTVPHSPPRDVGKAKSPAKTPTRSPVVKKIEQHSGTPEQKIVAASPQSARKPFWAYNAREGPRNLGGKPIPKGSPNCLQGSTFLITGILESIERDDAHRLIENCGGKVMKTLGKKTNYLVVGRDPGESKLAKAQNLNVKQLDEDEFFELIRSRSHEDKDTAVLTESAKPSPNPPSTKKKSPKNAPAHDESCALTGKPVMVHSIHQPDDTMHSIGETLWVDKYRPLSRRTLIGQNGPASPANRLFNWLSNWHEQFAAGAKARAYSSAPPWASGSGDDGKWARAALLSGPPGIGKTSSVAVVCAELGLSICELNASDSRSKKRLQDNISQAVQMTTLAAMATATGTHLSKQKHVLVMDEVDGMAGNEDRGGMQELIAMIKSSRIPIICMCNDRQSIKIRSLSNYCYDLRFQRPRVEQIKAALMSIACKEGISISPALLNSIIESSNHDIRQAINSLQMFAAGHSPESSENERAERLKDVRINAFDAIRKVFANDFRGSSAVNDSLDLFFQDYSLMPLFVQENYLSVRHRSGEYTPKQSLQLLAEASTDIATGDIISSVIRNAGSGSWSLLPMQGIFGLVRPGRMLRGSLPGGGPGGGVTFPSWFGKNSNQQRMRRVSGELAHHLILTTHGGSANVRSVAMDYLPVMAERLTKPLKEGDTGTVLNTMLHYNLQREDFDSILELTTWSNQPNRMQGIDSKVKSSLTRSLNKSNHLLPYATAAPLKGKSKRVADVDELDEGFPPEDDDDGAGRSSALVEDQSQSSDDEDADAMITQVKRKAESSTIDVKPAKKSKTASTKPESTRGRGRGKRS